MGIFRLSSQFIVWKTFVKQWENFWGRGVVESNFIINFHVFLFFLVLEAILKYLLQFISEYGELYTVEPGNQVE